MSTEKQILENLVATPEHDRLEWKSSMHYCYKDNCHKKDLHKNLIKPICAFANTRGGKLLVGYHEEKKFVGIEADGLSKEDWQKRLNQHLSSYIDSSIINPLFDLKFYEYEKDVTCVLITVKPTDPNDDLIPCKEVERRQREVFYIREKGETVILEATSLDKYRKNRKSSFKESNIQKGWSFNAETQIIDSLLTGWSQEYKYTWNNRNKIPDEKGIYIYLANFKKSEPLDSFNELKTIMYVGQARKGRSTFRDRYIDHWDEPDFEKAVQTFGTNLTFKYKVITGDALNYLSDFEQNIIDVFGPALNKIRAPSVNIKSPLRGRRPSNER